MTNNQLTDEQIAQWLGDACMVIGDRFATVDELSAAKAIRALAVEIQERRKAEMDSEPVAEVVSIYGDPEAFGEREIRPLVGIQQMPYGTKLYRHAQQPVVPDRSIFEKWWESQNGAPLDGWDSLRTTDGYCDDGIDGQFEAWNAAMLAAAPQEVPDGK